ncbi:MAG: winged helix-turn-helix domain-containing protein [Porticoccaceae bacterium]|nr:winged helix-turn-helix domain-containing protein [Porticoccaceae bacterium]
MDAKRVLLVEDDGRLATLVSEYLQQHEFIVEVVGRGDQALAEFKSGNFDLVILDLMLPGKDGLEVCRELRNIYAGPIMMLTAKSSDIDQVVGLELGADDYVIKPAEPRVLLARARALLRRGEASDNSPTELALGQLSICKTSHHVSLAGQRVILTTQEFGLLWLLACTAGQVLSRDTIYQELRGLEYDGLDRTVDVCISHLRKKLNDDSENPRRIKTVWGKGYLFAAEAWD